MASDALVSVASDALRGLLQAAMPRVAVALGAPDSVPEGVAVHLYRIAQLPLMRATPVISASGRRVRQAVNLQLDYLVAATAQEPLRAHHWLGGAVESLGRRPVMDAAQLRPLLRVPQALDLPGSGSLTVHWTLVDLPLADQCALWTACQAPQRAALHVRGEASWEGDADPTPVT